MNVIDAIGWTLLHFLWQGALVGGIYAALRARGRTPQTRYVLGLAALALCATIPVITLCWLWPSQPLAQSVQRLPVRPAGGMGSIDVADGELWRRIDIVLPWLVAFWCVGIALLAARSLRDWLRLTRARKHAVRVNAWSERVETLALRFGVHRCVDLLATAAVEAPTLLGVFKPAILLPTALLLRLPPAQLELILAHELSHVRRWDYLVNLAQVLLETLLFYHPAVHWLSSRLRTDRELCCDQDVLTTMGAPARSYAQALAELAETASHLAPAANGGVLVERIEILLAAPRTRGPTGVWMPLLSVAAALLLAFGLKQALEPAAIANPVASGARPTSASRLLAAAAPRPIAPPHAAMQVPRPSVAEKHDAGIAVAAVAQSDSTQKKSAGAKHEFSAQPKSSPLPERNAVEAHTSVVYHTVKPLARIGNETARVPVIDLVDRSLSFVTAPVASSSPPAPAHTSADQADAPTSDSAGQTSTRADAKQPQAAPQVTHFVAPVYPAESDMARGRVDLQFRIAADGSVQDVAVLAGGDHPQLARAAVAALRQWRFAPESAQPGHAYRQAIDFDQAVGAKSCRVPTGSHICRNDLGDEAVGVTVSTR
jgi:bla regulator protein BlaR1